MQNYPKAQLNDLPRNLLDLYLCTCVVSIHSHLPQISSRPNHTLWPLQHAKASGFTLTDLGSMLLCCDDNFLHLCSSKINGRHMQGTLASVSGFVSKHAWNVNVLDENGIGLPLNVGPLILSFLDCHGTWNSSDSVFRFQRLLETNRDILNWFSESWPSGGRDLDWRWLSRAVEEFSKDIKGSDEV